MSVFGMWMWPQNLRIYGADKVMTWCAHVGVTDVFFLVKGLAGTTVFPSDIAPHDGRDLLRELLDAAHQRGIRVHAWFTSASDEHYKALHPESGRCHYIRGKDRGLISLADEGYLAYMEDFTREICRRYDVDGLHLDYIRYNHLLYGWSGEDQARYARAGADIGHLRTLMDRMFCRDDANEPELLFDAFRAGDESTHALARTRRQDVVKFATTLTSLARAERSNLVLSAALMPEGAYDDTAFSDLHYGQNYEDAAKLYDLALPMAYSNAYEKDGQWVRQVAEGTMRRGLKTVVGLHAYEGGTGPSLQADIAALSGAPVEGVCLFREGATALACTQGRELQVINPMEAAITRIVAMNGSDAVTLNATIHPGEEKRLVLPFEADCARVFTADAEACIYVRTL